MLVSNIPEIPVNTTRKTSRHHEVQWPQHGWNMLSHRSPGTKHVELTDFRLTKDNIQNSKLLPYPVLRPQGWLYLRLAGVTC